MFSPRDKLMAEKSQLEINKGLINLVSRHIEEIARLRWETKILLYGQIMSSVTLIILGILLLLPR
jgi:hypothetical protein